MNLNELGWSPPLQSEWDAIDEATRDAALKPARVSSIERGAVMLLLENEDAAISASVAGSVFRAGEGDIAVGDWVVVRLEANESAVIKKRLGRKSSLHRKAAGEQNRAQVIAANLDHVLVVTDCDLDFNPRRVERYVTAICNGGATPVVVLNKADRCEDIAAVVAEAESVASGGDVIAISATEGLNLEKLERYLLAGNTIALVGSSGVGKSTLVNTLLAEGEQRGDRISEQPTQALGADGKGQHTTTARQLFALPGGALVIDTPGMREFGLWDATGAALESSFADVETLTTQCKFRNCQHADDVGCAVRAAIDSGELTTERLASYHKLARELERQKALVDRKKKAEQRQKQKTFSKKVRSKQKDKRGKS